MGTVTRIVRDFRSAALTSFRVQATDVAKSLLSQADGETCPFVEAPLKECYCTSMRSQDIQLTVYYCGNRFKDCEIYKRKHQGAGRA